MNRITPKDASRIKTYSDADDRMIAILEILTEVDIIPDVGRLYTFVYSPKTPEIEYDQNPLVVVSDIFRWGFRGYNFHWKSPRNYTWPELVGNLHKVNKEELNTLIALNYQKFRINT
jgi:hypothetical protein